MGAELFKQIEPKDENPYIKMRDKYRESADKTQQKIAYIQGAKYETALLRFMKKTKDNTELVNAMNKFLDALDHRSRYGNEEEPIDKDSIEKMTKFFQERAEELHFLVGNQPRRK